MPKTRNKLPDENTTVRFRVNGDTKLWHGTYTKAKGFEVCNGFLCYTMAEVNYWQPEAPQA